MGLRALTGPLAPRAPAKPAAAAITEQASATPFVLELSKPAKSVRIETLDGRPLARPDCGSSTTLAGTFALPASASQISLRIVWQEPATAGKPAPAGFARLTLDPPGKPTISHIFISARDLDDIWELSGHD